MVSAHNRETLRKAALQAAQEGYARMEQRATGTLPMEPRPVVTRKLRGKSATTQVEELAGLLAERATKIQETTETEVRHYLGAALAELAAASDEDIALMQYDGERAPVDEGYRAGLLLAARLVADPGFEL